MEFNFHDEEGSGLGPTLEYYNLFSNEMQDSKLALWRKTDSNHLFPNPSYLF